MRIFSTTFERRPSGSSFMYAFDSSRNGVFAFGDSFVTGIPVRLTYDSKQWSTRQTVSYSMHSTGCFDEVPSFAL